MALQDASGAALRKRLLRDLGITAAVLIFAFAGLLGYTRTWPPMADVTSGSMTHEAGMSAIGVLDPGDVVLVQAVSSPADIVTYLQGREDGYRAYGDYGDAVLFAAPGEPGNTAYLHRAMAFATWNASAGGYDVPELARLPATEWSAWDAGGNATPSTYGLSRFLVHHAGWREDLDIAFNLTAGERSLVVGVGTSGLLTMGDRNAYTTLTKVDRWVVPPADIIGVARGEIPWVGLIHLTWAPDPDGCCAGWGSTDSTRGAPANSWAALNLVLVLLVATPSSYILLERYLARHPEIRQKFRTGFRRLRFWERQPQDETVRTSGDENQGRNGN